MDAVLTSGAIQEILDGRSPSRPILRVTKIRKIRPRDSGETPSQASAFPSVQSKYKLYLYDGLQTHHFVLQASMNEKVESGEVEESSTVVLEKYYCIIIEERRIVVILNLKTRDPNAPQIPQPHPPPAQPSASPLAQAHHWPPVSPTSPSSSPRKISHLSPSSSPKKISHLSPYQPRWRICARVSWKSALRPTHSHSGEVFTMNLLDDTSEIRAVAFGSTASRLYPQLESGQVYYISKGRIQLPNPKFKSGNSTYEIFFGPETEVVPCTDEAIMRGLPLMATYNFVPIEEIPKLEADSIIDVIGVCKSCEEIRKTVIRRTDEEVSKRDITLTDRTGEVVCTLWRTEADNFKGAASPVVAVKDCKISTFGGRSLSVLPSSHVSVNPDVPEAHDLREWYHTEQTGPGSSAIADTTERECNVIA